jgi:hypothetical protein
MARLYPRRTTLAADGHCHLVRQLTPIAGCTTKDPIRLGSMIPILDRPTRSVIYIRHPLFRTGRSISWSEHLERAFQISR